ncbi:MAG: radical SAM protein [Parcubacteria group bacterium]|nr:radical SAM protein [Parcubacteria group bacterium]
MNSIHPADVVKDIKPADLRNLNAVFINMPLRETAVPNNTPQGPLLLATNLRKNYGINATVIDLNGYRVKDELAQKRGLVNGRHLTEPEVFELIKKHFEVHGEPDLVGFSGKITTLRWQEKVAKMIRELLPNVFLVSGNGLATELKAGLFNYIPELDGVARSEGDDVIIKIAYDAKIIKEMGFANAINSGKLAPYYVGEIHGCYRFLYEGDRPRDLDAIPFADLDLLKEDVFGYEMLEYYLGNAIWGTSANNSSATSFEMRRSTNFVSSRGCPYACAFCFRGAQGERNYGMRSAKNLAEEFKLHIEKYGVDFIGMPDDNFGVDYHRIVELVPYLKPLGVRWGTHTRLDESAGLRPKAGKPGEYIFEDPKRVDLMAEAGCVYIGFGAESASPSVLKAMNKGGFILKNGLTPIRVDGKTYEFPRTMIEGIKNCDLAGIHANCTWIMAYPTETLEDLKISVAFIKWQEDFYTSRGKLPDSVNRRMFTATWYPGTEMLNHPKVKKMLNEVFGINFNPVTREPICDENFHQYVLELDDATKLLHNPQTGEPLNFGDMPMDTFLRARECVDSDETFKILEM